MKITYRIGLLSIMHLITDLVCVGSLMFYISIAKPDNYGYMLLVYNCVAFLLQPLFGFLADKFNKTIQLKILMASSGVLVLLGWGMSLLHIGYAAAILVGLGNALFHSVGGKQALMQSKKATPGGVFVSLGAIGLGTGVLFLSVTVPSFIIYFIFPAIVLGFWILHFFTNWDTEEIQYDKPKTVSIAALAVSLVLLCIAVAIRSFLGFFATMSELIDTNIETFLLSVFAFLGKAAGGIILDFAGPYILIAISTLIGVVSAFFLKYVPVDYAFVFSINILMPLTLDMMRKHFINKEGFAFGFTAAFLIPGYLFAMVAKGNAPGILTWIIALVSGIMLIGYCLLIKDKRICFRKS